MTESELYTALCLPQELADALRTTKCDLSAQEQAAFSQGLRGKDTYAAAAKQLKARLLEDERGLGMLRVMLAVACDTHDMYRSRHIPDDIYFATMKCFVRFACEHKESYGTYGFDRSWWVGRQLSMQLYRLGELEYELSEWDGQPAVSLHIPSDADLSEAGIAASVGAAKAFLAKYDPMYSDTPIFCASWLLSPSLEGLLSPTSRIAGFRRHFRIVRYLPEPEDYKQWVYKDPRLAPEDFPENTSLQRSIKQYVLAGGKVGEGIGLLVTDKLTDTPCM